MASALKDIYNELFIQKLIASIKNEYPPFQGEEFFSAIFDEQWEQRTLKERMRHITLKLNEGLPEDYEESLDILMKVAPHFKHEDLAAIIFPDYVEVFGLEHWEPSLAALEHFTMYSTSEFAVRPFIIKDLGKMAKQMEHWAISSHASVRRLASEGMRPRLPWGVALQSLKKDPSPIMPILELLKKDESLYVRKSVANNLNDISKDHPQLVLALAEKWLGTHPNTDWIIKHACRTLLKKGDPAALSLFGYSGAEGISVQNFRIENETIHIGGELLFSFAITSERTEPTPIRLEYRIHYAKALGKQSAKIFKITENTISKDKPLLYKKKQSFKDMTTRKHYPGDHTISILINGEEKAKLSFIVR
ncbi:DNA alkylation repair protein [Cytobacillus gottheilii]|uniref:DNA alkylation repair protein n=1 Tax=Cytobacillus gottheilii TaxID=859144 RepID=UPI0009B9C71F|nr:DNA alkylation repair protein [Cytobacillus gottheilii]